MTRSGTGSGAPTARHTVVGAFDDTPHAERARRDLAAAGFTPEQVTGVAGAVVPAPAVGVGRPGQQREAALGGAFLGGIAGWLLGLGAVALPGLGPLTGAGSAAAAVFCAALGAAAGALLGRPVAARASRVGSLLLQVGACEDREVGQVRALLARAGATRTWAYRVPRPRTVVESGGRLGSLLNVEGRQEPGLASSPARQRTGGGGVEALAMLPDALARDIVAHLCGEACHGIGQTVELCESRGDCVIVVTCGGCGQSFTLDDDQYEALAAWSEAHGEALACGIARLPRLNLSYR